MNKQSFSHLEVLERLKSMPTSRLVDEAAILKDEVNRLSEELRLMNQELSERVEFRQGSKTSHAFGRLHSAKIQLKENVIWDQEALKSLRRDMGEEDFFKVFHQIYEPRNNRTLTGALEFGPHSKAIEATRTVSPGAPQVTYEKRGHNFIPELNSQSHLLSELCQ